MKIKWYYVLLLWVIFAVYFLTVASIKNPMYGNEPLFYVLLPLIFVSLYTLVWSWKNLAKWKAFIVFIGILFIINMLSGSFIYETYIRSDESKQLEANPFSGSVGQ
tara:strand:- start:81 stop:398 length:318 start_codon:yes stop_codon:yes gene_type:complete